MNERLYKKKKWGVFCYKFEASKQGDQALKTLKEKHFVSL